MKLIIFGSILLGIGYSLADNISNTGVFIPSEKCLTEVNKYSGCLEGKDLNSINNIKNSNSVKDFCKIFEGDKCKEFVKDITISESGCIEPRNPNFTDLYTGLIFTSMKVAYAVFCAKDSEGNICPFSQYLVDNFEKINENITDLAPEGKTALANDCRDTTCYDRMVSIQSISENLKNLSENMETGDIDADDSLVFSNSTQILEKYYDQYVKKECNSIDGSSGSSDAVSLRKITYSIITIIIFSIMMLI